MNENKALQEAVRIAGGPTALARKLGVSVAQLWEIRVGRRPLPLPWCEPIWRATSVSPARLRADAEWTREGERWFYRERSK